jgi:hypothetical protein
MLAFNIRAKYSPTYISQTSAVVDMPALITQLVSHEAILMP